MVLLGGLEFVAAGYLLAEHSKHKKERKRLELQNQHLLNHAVAPHSQPPPHHRRRYSDSDRRPSRTAPVREVREKRREEKHRDSEKYRSSEKHREHRDSSSDSKRRHESSSRPHKCSSNSSRLALPLAAVAVTAASRTNLTQPSRTNQTQPSRTNLAQPPRPSSQQPRKSRRGSSAPPTQRQDLVPYQPTPLHQHYPPVAPPPYPTYNAPPATSRPNCAYPPPTPMVPSSSRPVPGSWGGRSELSGHSVPRQHSYIPPRDGAWELPASEVGHPRPARAGAMGPHVHFEDGLSTLKEPVEPPPPYREY